MQILLLPLLLSLADGTADSAEQSEPPAPRPTELNSLDPDVGGWRRDGKGLSYEADNGFEIHAWLRAQLRYSTPFDSDPRTPETTNDPPGADSEVRRARIKVDGQLFSQRVGYYFEHELSGDRPLLDLRLDVAATENLLFRIGQYKVLYNRERVDSSGKQQFVERSISTYPFTLDRQRGAAAAWHVAEGTRGDSWFMAGVYEGDGIDPDQKGDDPLVLARWQWQFLREALPFSQSDFRQRERPAATVSLAASHVRGPYTRFSSSGGGQLDGFESGGDDRYTLRQWQQGFAWQYRGFSFQQELHGKRIEDHETGLDSTLRGGYAQAGKAWPIQLGERAAAFEVAIRGARVDWEDTPRDREQREFTVVTNLFLNGHDSKITAEFGRLTVRETGIPTAADTRFRLQWDVSF